MFSIILWQDCTQEFKYICILLFFRRLSELPTWKEEILHDIIDAFLKIRFPTYLVLNKVDTTTAEENIARYGPDSLEN